MHISKRDTISLSKAWSIRAIAILLALIVDGIIIYAIVKMNPLKVYVSLASGAFGTSKRMWFTIRDCMILTCIAIGLAPAFKMRFWNVGAEGQMLVGGIATAFWMINLPRLRAWRPHLQLPDHHAAHEPERHRPDPDDPRLRRRQLLRREPQQARRRRRPGLRSRDLAGIPQLLAFPRQFL